MANRHTPYRSWNAMALGLKTEEFVEEPKDRQRPRSESWSQPTQRGRSIRGRGFWTIDNRPRPQIPRRNTMPNSNYSYSSSNESNGYSYSENDNPILEEPPNSPEGDFQDEISRNNKYSIYHHPKSRSSDHPTNGFKEYHKVQWNKSWEREPKINDLNQAWPHDKYELVNSDSDSGDKKDASSPVSTLNINSESQNENNTQEIMVSECEPLEQIVVNSELPKEITVKFSELTLKESCDESIASQNQIQEEEATDNRVASEVNPKVSSEITSETNPDPLPLINLDDDDNIDVLPTHPKISEDILTLDWEGYQKGLLEEELRRTMERQTIQTSNPHKLDTGLKDFDTLL